MPPKLIWLPLRIYLNKWRINEHAIFHILLNYFQYLAHGSATLTVFKQLLSLGENNCICS